MSYAIKDEKAQFCSLITEAKDHHLWYQAGLSDDFFHSNLTDIQRRRPAGLQRQDEEFTVTVTKQQGEALTDSSFMGQIGSLKGKSTGRYSGALRWTVSYSGLDYWTPLRALGTVKAVGPPSFN